MLSEHKTSWRVKFRSDMVLAILIFLIPFFSYIHLIYSDTSLFIDLFGLKYLHVFPSNRTFVWYLLRNLIPIMLLIIWFFSSSKAWKYLIIIIVMIYANSLLKYVFMPLMKPILNKIFYVFDYTSITYGLILFFVSILVFLDFYYFKNYRAQVLNISFKSILIEHTNNNTYNYKNVLNKVRENKNKYTKTSYLNRIVNVKLVIDKWMKNSMLLDECRQVNKEINFKDYLVSVLLLTTSLLWYSHHLIPEHLEEFTLGFISIDSNGFDNIRTYIWFLTRKLIVIIPMLTWYIICTSWWRFAILSPLVIYSYQLWEATQDVQYLDAAGNIKSFPIIVLVVIILMMVSKIIKYRVDLLVLYETLVKEIDVIIEDGEFNANKGFQRNLLQIKQLRKEIAGESNQNTKLIRLISLRDQLLEGRYGVD